MSLAQAADRRGQAGQPLPTVYAALEAAGANICLAQLTLIMGPPSAGKSLLGMNLLSAWQRPSLAFLLDTDQLSAAARFASIISGEFFAATKANIDDYRPALAREAAHIQTAFHATDADDIDLQLAAYAQRFGQPPDVLLVDNLGNMSSGFDGEWAVLKAMCLELDNIARREQIAVVACHHTTDLETMEPASRTKMLGKVSQYARLILSVNFNDATGDYKVAVVKNSSGPTDVRAERPIQMWADPARVAVTDNYQLAHAWRQR